MRKIKKRGKLRILILLVVFQIFLLTNYVVAQSYNIHQTDELIEKAKIATDKDGLQGLINEGLNLLVSLLTIKQIGTISAESLSCCIEARNGAFCQDVAPGDTITCKESPIPNPCENVVECGLGCCIDEAEGICSSRSSKMRCEENGGLWKDEASCLVEECVQGCCILGENVEFTTEGQCVKLSRELGTNITYEKNLGELECLGIKATQETGACVFPNGNCVFGTELECKETGGEFVGGYLCSNPELRTVCTKQVSIGCAEGKDEIYWFDSCGNRENIYDSNKEKSWNNGKVLSKEESCNSNSGNIESENCGNCNYMLGSQCSESGLGTKSVKDGGFICENKNCIDSKGRERKNGESWCVYDGFIGDGKDTVGSRHWKMECIDGEVKSSGCAEFRSEICTESKMEGDATFTIANCVVNDAIRCIEINQEAAESGGDVEALIKECGENPHCFIKHTDIDDGFEFDVCAAKYPKGFDLTGEKNQETAQQMCDYADQECVVIYEKKTSGWKCVQNCECETKEFAQQMNDLCIILGDCGTYVNFKGKGSDNINVDGAPEEVNWLQYSKYAVPVPGQKGEAPDSSEFLKSVMGDDLVFNVDRSYDSSTVDYTDLKFMGKVAGASIPLMLGTTYAISYAAINAHVGAYGYSQAMAEAFGSGTSIAGGAAKSTISGTMANLGAAFAAFAIAMAAAMILTKVFGLQGEAATIMAITGAAVGAVWAGIAAAGEGFFWCWICLIIILVIAIILKIVGIGEIEKKKVKFDCNVWTPPIGGNDCDKCNDDPLKPCTEYRCTSLGAACYINNETLGTDNPICETSKNDGRGPEINAGEIGYSYAFFNEKENERVEIRTENKKCIPEFSQVIFSLETDENAQCKYSFTKGTDLENAEGSFEEGTSFVKSHLTGFMAPSLDSLQVYNVSGNVKEMFGNMEMYVTCQDTHGNKNKKEYVVNFCVNSGPDVTSPQIVKTDPLNEQLLGYGVTEKEVKFYLNEPAECRYSLEDDVNFEDMSNSMSCQTELTDYSLYGWECVTTFTDLTRKNKFNIRCKDQPWLPAENDSQRNANTQDYVYILETSESELSINSISPSGIIEEGFEPVAVDLEVVTSGGAENGKAKCSYSFLGYGSMLNFINTYSTKHKQPFNTMMSGNFKIYVECEDIAGNTARGETEFTIDVDTDAPMIVRAYQESGYLNLITNEIGECVYDEVSCNYLYDEGIVLNTVGGIKHYVEWAPEKTFYIKCKDVWDNTVPSTSCSMVVKPTLNE